MIDRRKPWQKAAQAYPWAKDGKTLAETEKALGAPEPRRSESLAISLYARAMGITYYEAQARMEAQRQRLASS